MFYMLLLLILLIGITCSLLGLSDQSFAKACYTSPDLDVGSPQDFGSCNPKRRGLFKLAVL